MLLKGWCAMLLQASLVRHASIGLLLICSFCLCFSYSSPGIVTKATETTQTGRFRRLMGRRVMGSAWEKSDFQKCFWKIFSTIANAANHMLMRSLPHAFKVHCTQLFSVIHMFKIAVMLATTTGKRLTIMILHTVGKMCYVKQGKINTNNQTFTSRIYKQHLCGLHSVEKAKDQLTCW